MTDGTGHTEVPAEALSAQALEALLEEFVTRDGTDYGAIERSLAEKVADVRCQLERGELRIVLDSETETVTLVPSDPR